MFCYCMLVVVYQMYNISTLCLDNAYISFNIITEEY